MAEVNYQKLVEIGRRVERLLADEDVQAALAAVERDAFAAFRGASTPAERDDAWLEVRGLDALQRALKRKVDAGKTAAVQLDRENRTR